jgi:hypothetical protein
MIKNIIYNNNLLAIIIRANFKDDGIKFFTPNEFSQQLGYMHHPKGYTIKPHLHNNIPRNINFTKEVLFIKSGKLRIDFYNDDKDYIESYILNSGDVILLASGGHGFEMLEPTELIEVKQGPYLENADKNRFNSVDKKNLKIKN